MTFHVIFFLQMLELNT